MLLSGKPRDYEDICFLVWLGSEMCFEEELPDEITAEIFATEILGFTMSPDFRQGPTDGQ